MKLTGKNRPTDICLPLVGCLLSECAADPIESPHLLQVLFLPRVLASSSLNSTREAPMTVDMSACVCISVKGTGSQHKLPLTTCRMLPNNVFFTHLIHLIVIYYLVMMLYNVFLSIYIYTVPFAQLFSQWNDFPFVFDSTALLRLGKTLTEVKLILMWRSGFDMNY